MTPQRIDRAKAHQTPRTIVLFFLTLLLPACTTPITTPDEMREAVLANRVRDVRHAVAAGFPLNEDVAYCFPVVPFAAALGHRRMVLAIIDQAKDASVTNQKNCMGHTALHFAALTNQKDLERELLARGADGDVRDHLERSAEDLRPRPLSALP